MSTRSRDEPSQREPEAPVGGLTEKTDERAAQNPAVNSWLLAQQVVRQRAHVVAEVIVGRLAESHSSLCSVMSCRTRVRKAAREGWRRMSPVCKRAAMRPLRQKLPSVPSMAAERLAEDEGAADELADPDDVEVRAGPEPLGLRRGSGQDHRQQRASEHQGALRAPDPGRRVVLVVPERKEDALHWSLVAVL